MSDLTNINTGVPFEHQYNTLTTRQQWELKQLSKIHECEYSVGVNDWWTCGCGEVQGRLADIAKLKEEEMTRQTKLAFSEAKGYLD